MPTCTRRRSRSSSLRPQISTQKLVVSAVRAESALLKAAATMPNANNTCTAMPNCPVAAYMGSNSSPLAGKATPWRPASTTSSTRSAMNSRLTGTKAKP